MSFYQEQKKEKRNKAIVKGIKIACWCLVAASWLGYCGSVELKDICSMHDPGYCQQ
jgi:hypothetical protein